MVMHFAELSPEHIAQQPVMQVAYPHQMAISSLRHLRRKANLDRLVAEAGGSTALSLLVDTPKSHISALQSGSRGIGDRLAQKLERKFDKPPGWMDEPHDDEVMRQPGGRLLIVDGEKDTAFYTTPTREDLELLRDLIDMQDSERAWFLQAIRARSEAFIKKQAGLPSGLSMGTVALALAQSAAALSDRTRGHVAHLAGEMIQNGPDATQAAAIDALATVNVGIPSTNDAPSTVDHPLTGGFLDIDQGVLAAVQDLARASLTMTEPQRRAMVAALQAIKETSWDTTQELSSGRTVQMPQDEPGTQPIYRSPGRRTEVKTKRGSK